MRTVLDAPTPVLVLGMSTRCGSTHLQHLIAAHPDCWTPPSFRVDGRDGIDEDFFLYDADRLAKYLDGLTARPNGVQKGAREELWAYVGHGLISFAGRNAPEGARLVLKTPSCKGIAYKERLFPTATAVVVIRDPRDTVASGVASWTPDFTLWCEYLRDRLEIVLRAQRTSGAIDVLVRFERLVHDPHTVVRNLCDALALNPDRYPWDTLRDSPVRGHSGNFREHKTAPMPKPPGFDPVGRWRDWTPAQAITFDAACGEFARRLGYHMEEPEWLAKLD